MGHLTCSRPRKYSAPYASIWMEARLTASRLYQASGRTDPSAACCRGPSGGGLRVAMRYGQPSNRQAIKDLATRRASEHILTVPLYRQYSSSTTGTVRRLKFTRVASHMRNQPPVRFIQSDSMLDPALYQPFGQHRSSYFGKKMV